MFKFKNSNLGFGLIEIIVAVGLLAIISAFASKLIVNGMKGQASLSARVDMDALKMTLLQKLNCERTINPTSIPATCPATIVLKDRVNQNVLSAGNKLGVWTVTTTCDSGGLSFAVAKSGKDPLTGKDWTDVSKAKDLFNGIKLCANLFGGGCPASHPVLLPGGDGQGRCCRSWLQQDLGTTASASGKYLCNPSEVVTAAGYACHQPNVDPRYVGAYIPAMNYSVATGAGYILETTAGVTRMGYTVSCRGSSDAPAGWNTVGAVHWGSCCIE